MRLYLFADESGNFDFSRGTDATRFYSVGTFAVPDDGTMDELVCAFNRLRLDLGWAGTPPKNGDYFHATEDSQRVRDAVYAVLASFASRTQGDVTLFEKSKTQPHLRTTEPDFYGHAWFQHLKPMKWRASHAADELVIVAASLGTKKTGAAFRNAVERAVLLSNEGRLHRRVLVHSARSDLCVQAADYMLWAVSRSWERQDDRALNSIPGLVRSQYDLFSSGKTHYY